MQLAVQHRATLARARMKELGISQQEVADALGMEQSKVSRLLSAKFKKPSPSFELLCRHLKVDAPLDSGPLDQELHQAIQEVWDGTKEHAAALAAVIRALRPLRQI